MANSHEREGVRGRGQGREHIWVSNKSRAIKNQFRRSLEIFSIEYHVIIANEKIYISNL